MAFLKNGSLKEGIGQQWWKCSKEMKSGKGILISVSGVIKEIAAHECWHYHSWKDPSYGARGTQGRQNWQKWEKWLGRKGSKCPRGSGAGKNKKQNNNNKHFTLKELSKIAHITESVKDKIPESDLNWEKTMTICQGIEMIFLYCKLHNAKQASAIQTTSVPFFYKIM